MIHAIQLQNISISYGEKHVLRNISLDIESDKITAIIGPNGCGKSTLLKIINGLLLPHDGHVKIQGDCLRNVTRKQMAQRVSFLEQSPSAPPEMSILQLVKLGRYCHQNILQQWSDTDENAVNQALTQAGLTDMIHRRISDVSGGQLQRAWWAMCLAQDSHILLLDEPINHLDMTYQLECLDAVVALHQKHHKTIIMVLHDVNLAMRYAHTIIAMTADGDVYAHGTPHDIINPQLFADIFHVSGNILTCPDTQVPIFVPLHKV